MTGTRCCGDEVVERGEEQRVGAVGADDEGRGGAGDILLGHVDGDLAGVGRGMAGGDDELGRIVGVGRAEGVGVACDAGVDLAVGGAHGEFGDSSLGYVGCAVISGAGLWVGPSDEVAIFVGGRRVPSGRSAAT